MGTVNLLRENIINIGDGFNHLWRHNEKETKDGNDKFENPKQQSMTCRKKTTFFFWQNTTKNDRKKGRKTEKTENRTTSITDKSRLWLKEKKLKKSRAQSQRTFQKQMTVSFCWKILQQVKGSSNAPEAQLIAMLNRPVNNNNNVH